MIVYNTTYTVANEDARNFVIWVHQSLIPVAVKDGMMAKPRLLRILSHRDQETECFSLQMEAESTTVLHKWYVGQGQRLQQEMDKVFEKRVLAFSTIMEVITENGE